MVLDAWTPARPIHKGGRPLWMRPDVQASRYLMATLCKTLSATLCKTEISEKTSKKGRCPDFHSVFAHEQKRSKKGVGSKKQLSHEKKKKSFVDFTHYQLTYFPGLLMPWSSQSSGKSAEKSLQHHIVSRSCENHPWVFQKRVMGSQRLWCVCVHPLLDLIGFE